MKKPIYKFLGKTIWHIEYDFTLESGYQGHRYTIATMDEFKFSQIMAKSINGFTAFNIRKKHATEEECTFYEN